MSARPYPAPGFDNLPVLFVNLCVPRDYLEYINCLKLFLPRLLVYVYRDYLAHVNFP